MKKLEQFPELKDVLKLMLFSGKKTAFNPDEKFMQMAESFNFITNFNGAVSISSRILGTRLYNLFTAESQMESIYTEGSIDKCQFISGGRTIVEAVV